MAYAQWIEVRVQSENMTVKIKNAGLSWGKFYKKDAKDSEMSSGDVNGIEISSGNEAFISACGRSGSWSGTEGGFDLYEGETKLGRFQWNCPWDSGDNYFDLIEKKAGYNLSYSGGNRHDGAIGNVTVVCIKN